MNHILLLEDIPEIRAWLKALVKQVFANAQITECSRVQDALSLVNGQRFTLALLDLGLPDGSGVEVIAALREKQPEVQSVIVTIHDDDEHLFPALQAGAFGYLLKEQSRELLVEQLQRMSQGEPPLSPSIARKVIAYFAAHAKPSSQALLHEVSLTDRETGAAARRQGLHLAGNRRATGPVPPHDRRLREADLPQAQRELSRRGRLGGTTSGFVRSQLTQGRPG